MHSAGKCEDINSVRFCSVSAAFLQHFWRYLYRCAVRKNLSSQIGPHKSVLTNLFSKFGEFLAGRSQFDTDHRVDFLNAYMLPIRDLWTAFCVLLSFVFLRNKIIYNVAIRQRCDFYPAVFAKMSPPLRLIAR